MGMHVVAGLSICGLCAIAVACLDEPSLEVDLNPRTEVVHSNEGALPADMMFASSWARGGIGATDVAVTDSGYWTGGGTAFEIIPVDGSGFAFPTTNMLVITPSARAGGGASTAALRTNGLPIPAPGGSLYFRQYWAMGVPDGWSGDNGSTSVRDGTSGTENWSQDVINSSGSWSLSFAVPASWPNNRWTVTGLDKDTVYRLEWRILRVTAETFTLEPRIYGDSGALLHGSESFVNVNGSATLADTPPPELSIEAEEAFASLQVGVRGLSSGDSWGWTYARAAGYCVRSQDWCGPFNPLEESSTAESTPQSPGAPMIAAAAPTDTSVLVTSSPFAGTEGDVHDSTLWRIRDAATLAVIWSDTTADSLSSFGASGAGASAPLASGVGYLIDAQHHGGQSQAWSGFGEATAFTTSTTASQSEAVLFHSDWSTATGESTAALLDSNKEFPWDAVKGDQNGGAVVTDSVSWPDGIAHGLTIAHLVPNDNPGVRLAGSLPAFNRGDTRSWRVYFKYVAPDTSDFGDPSQHPMQDGAGGSNTNWELNTHDMEDGTWVPSLTLAGYCAGCGSGATWRAFTLAEDCLRSSRCALPKDSVYRIEWKLNYHPAADSIDIDVQLYNADGTLRNGPGDWHRPEGGTSADTIWYSIPNPGTLQDLQIGTNGWGSPSSTPNIPYVAWHWAAVAICRDWCGEYPIAGVESSAP